MQEKESPITDVEEWLGDGGLGSSTSPQTGL